MNDDKALMIQQAHELMKNDQFSSAIMVELVQLWFDTKGIATTIQSLINESFIKTNSGEIYRDNKVVLEAVKLILQLAKVKGLSSTTNVAIFNNTPQGDKLQY